jgi:alkylation response protein AidB-like acyl-CoA dehydrogenase
MGHYKINEEDVFFILKDQLNYGSLCRLERYRDFDEDTLDMLVKEAIKFAKAELSPLMEIGEKWGVVFEDGQVRSAPEYKRAFQVMGENGWIGAVRDPEYGGQGFPDMMRIVLNDFMYGADQSFNMAPSLASGSADLIWTFGSDELKERFVRKMWSGQWAGTMALTEPNAGSDLSAVRTTAVPEGDHYKIRGTKLFISWGDHDLTENIVHLLLARIEGAPEGVKGISLFVAPKYRVNADGSVGEANDVICTAVERKMGLHASPTCALNFGDNDGCIGYLCGEENKGLAHMFRLMNGARINTGVSGMTLASTAYQNALAYTKERVQGSDIARRKTGPIPIIDHSDVRRMLLWMKAMVEGMRSLVYTGAFWLDLSHAMPEEEERARYQALVDFLTPITKAYCSDMGFRVCETAVQCLGGYGYCAEYPLEKYLRDVKIMSLYEGTNGIQSVDLMGRKMRLNDGAPYRAYMGELEKFCTEHRDHPTVGDAVRNLASTVRAMAEVTGEMSKRMKSDPLQWASCTYPALLCFGDVTVTWRLLDMAVTAQRMLDQGKANDFYRGKVMQATYFAGVTLPLTLARLETCKRDGREVVEMPEEAF